MQKIMQFIDKELKKGNDIALIQITKTTGSSPASPGQLMAVSDSKKTCGTVGGGMTEFQIIERTMEAFKQKEKIFDFYFDHAESGMTCGGSMEGFGNVWSKQNRLFIFGGGHVAQKLYQIANLTGFYISIIEDREEFRTYFPHAQFILSEPKEYAECVKLKEGDYVVICTRNHKNDGDALSYCLPFPCKYIGMIGSKQKVAQVFDDLKKQGLTEEQLNRVYAPIGLSIAHTDPAEIAVSILAELLMVKNETTLHINKIAHELS